MLELIICWFIGHDPTEPILFPVLAGEELSITFCKRCGQAITFKPGSGWIKW